MKKILFPFLTIIFSILIIQPSYVYLLHSKPLSSSDILDFCENNGMKYLTFVSIDTNVRDPRTFLVELLKGSKLRPSLRTRYIESGRNDQEQNFVSSLTEYDKDTLVVTSSPNTAEWKHYLKLIAKRKIMSSLFVIV